MQFFFPFPSWKKIDDAKIVFFPFPGPSLSRVRRILPGMHKQYGSPPFPLFASITVRPYVRPSVAGSRKSESKRGGRGGGGGGDELLYYLLLTMGQQAMGRGRRRRKEVAYGAAAAVGRMDSMHMGTHVRV